MNEKQFPKMNIVRCSGCHSCGQSCPTICYCPCPGPAGADGAPGEAATIEIGTVTTGAPGTEAEVTNSGTATHAILDFVIPQGECSCPTTPAFLTAYSTAPQSVVAGDALIFDRNASSSGTAISHENNSSDIVINEAGVYNVSFHGTISPEKGDSFPVSILLSLQQDGNPIPGAAVRENFQSAQEVRNLSFSQVISVDTAPTTLTMVVDGSNIQYSDAAISVSQIGK